MITRTDVETAADRIAGHVRRPPVLPVERDVFGGAVWWKLELLQHTGSFKSRGAHNRILAAVEAGTLTGAGVVAASGGNAGLAVAHVAQRLGIAAEVYVPGTAPRHKVAALSALGATVRQVGDQYADAYAAAVAQAERTGALFCHPYDQPEICAGQGSLGLELLDEVPALDTVVLAVGGGGLMAGVAAALEGHARVVGVEPQTIPTLHTALRSGGPVDVEVSGIAADSLGARRLGTIAYQVAVRTGVRSVLVPETAIVEARRLLWQRWRLVIEHGAATAVAALLTGAYRPETDERAAVLLCGGNTDPRDLVD